MVNCNPETVSTDYDTSDRLYFEPLTAEDVANVIDAETDASEGAGRVSRGSSSRSAARPRSSWQTPSSPGLVLGTRLRRSTLQRTGRGGTPSAKAWGYPNRRWHGDDVHDALTCRPHRLPSARPAELCARWPCDGDRLRRREVEQRQARRSSGPSKRGRRVSAERAVLVDRFLEDAVEVDVDAVRDSTGEVLVAGVMEHVEEAGIHSGDSACAFPPQTLSPEVVRASRAHTRAIAAELSVVGLVNVQYAVREGDIYVLEANPRASRTVPFVAKATGVPLAKVAARVMIGSTLADLRDERLLTEPRRGKQRKREGGRAALQPLSR